MHRRASAVPPREGTLRVISPNLSGADGAEADGFVAGLVSRVQRHVEQLRQDTDLTSSPGHNDVVVVLVPTVTGGSWRRPVRDYLARAANVGADVLPVGLQGSEPPPPPLKDLAPFDVTRMKKAYHLGPNQDREAGAIFARVALARMWPTYSHERLKLFLSHRHEDCSEIAATLSSALHDLHHFSALDFVDIRPGTSIGARIVEELDDSDVFVFCDTPKAAGDHAWLKTELCVALGMALPIIWVRFGQVGHKSELLFRPSDQPDLDLAWPHDETDYHEIADKIIDRAIVAGRNQVRRVEACLKQVYENSVVDVLDERWRLLMVRRRASFGPFPVEQRIVLQAYSRRPTSRDRAKLRELLISHGLVSAKGGWPTYGLALMVGPAPACDRGVAGVRSSLADDEEFSYLHAGAVAAELRQPATFRQPADPPELLLFAALGYGSGAWQEFRDAVQDVATHWIARGGRIRFGGHPTVTPTVHWAARSVAPGQEKQRVTVYQSLHFVTPQLLEEIAQIADAHGTDSRGEGETARQLSLTHMREEMIKTSRAVAAVVIGGLTRADRGGLPGVEEEMLLARAEEIPVFLFGATGGQAAVLAADARAHEAPYSALGNRLAEDENDFITTTDDYTAAIELVWNSTVV